MFRAQTLIKSKMFQHQRRERHCNVEHPVHPLHHVLTGATQAKPGSDEAAETEGQPHQKGIRELEELDLK